MDAVSLSLPTNTLANRAMAAADKAASALPVDAEGVRLDFATLLAVGLNMQPLTDPVRPEATLPGKDDSSPTQEPIDPVALLADPNQALLTAPQLTPVPAQVAEKPVNPLQHMERGEHADAKPKVELSAAAREAGKAPLAAEPATIAARSEQAADRQVANFQAELAQQADLARLADGQRVEGAAEAAAHALNLPAVEQRPVSQQPTAVLQVSAPVSSPGFADALSQQVVWMVDKDAQVAELRINPPELGPVEVRLTVNGDQASAQFVSTHQEVREALETSIARLRESFAEAGIQLGQASVSAESFREQSGAQADSRATTQTAYGATPAQTEATASPQAPMRVLRGLVDTFA